MITINALNSTHSNSPSRCNEFSDSDVELGFESYLEARNFKDLKGNRVNPASKKPKTGSWW